MQTLNLILVDDDMAVANMMLRKLSSEAPHFSITAVRGGRECLEYINEMEVDCILSDYQMPGMSGMELLKRLREQGNVVPFIFLTGQGGEEVAREAFKNGAYDYCTKEIGFAHFPRIINSVEQAVNHRLAEQSKAKAEAALARERAQLLSIFDSMNDVVYVSDPLTHEILFANRALKDLHGKELIGRLCYQEFQGLGSPCGFCTNETILENGGRPHRWELTNSINGRRYSLVDRIIKWPDCRDVRFEIATDVTELKEAEDALRESEERFRSVVQTASDAVVLIDKNENFVFWNSKAEEIFGYSADEAIGNPASIIIPERFRRGHKALTGLAFKTGGLEVSGKDVEMVGLRKGGEEFPLEVSLAAWSIERGMYVTAICRDITERKKAEEEQARLESIAAAVNSMDNIGYIFAGIRHEIGSPITSLKMTLSILAENIQDYPKELIKDYMERSLAEIARVEYLLNSLKNFNMYECPVRGNVRVTAFMENLISLVPEGLREKGIKLNTFISPYVGFVFADPRALQQVMLNIIANACDALEGREGPEVSISVFSAKDVVLIQVQDNGCGMTDAQLGNLFKPFYTSKPKGTGLGLVIARKLLASMGGSIEIQSMKDTGTKVHISIPEGKEQDA